MEMEMEVTVEAVFDRLQAAAVALEQAADRLAAVELEAAGSREHELAERLAEAEGTINTLRAQMATQQAAQPAGGRKTVAAGVLSAKEGVALEAGSIDAALGSLSIEQRIAVKAQLMRSGLLG